MPEFVKGLGLSRLFFEEAVRPLLGAEFPRHFRGYPTGFTEPDPSDSNVQHLEARDSGPVQHKVELTTPRGFFLNYLAFDIRDEIEPADWLTFPSRSSAPSRRAQSSTTKSASKKRAAASTTTRATPRKLYE